MTYILLSLYYFFCCVL